jgi:dihydrofolate reductase
MTRTRYFTATTLDGFIATEDHSLEWLFHREQDRDRRGALNYDDFIQEIGAIGMGASTYRWIQAHHGDEPWMYDVPAWVFTHHELAPRTDADIRFTSAPVPDVHAEMAEVAGSKDIWIVGGGDLVGQFHDHGLLDEVIVTIAPVTIGAGKPLLARHVELELEELAQSGAFASARYSVVRAPDAPA